MSKFVVLVNYKKPLEEIDHYLAVHRSFLDEGYQQDFFIASGSQNPRKGGVIISQLTDKAQLERILRNDPFFIHDLADYEIIEFMPSKYHKNFHCFIEHKL